MLNGDTFFGVNLKVLKSFHAEHGSEWTFALFRTHEIGRYMGMEVTNDGRILSLQSDAARPGRLANGGVYLVESSVLKGFEKETGKKSSLEDDILPSILNQWRRLYGVEQFGPFIDIGVPEDYLRAADVLR